MIKVLRKRTISSSIMFSLELSRDVDVDGDVGPVIVKANNSLNKHSILLFYGPLGQIVATDYDDISIAITIDEQVIIAIGTDDVREYETAHEGIDAYISLVLADMKHKLNTAFELEE